MRAALDGLFSGLGLLGTGTAVVVRPTDGGVDAYNAAVAGEPEREEVPGVMASPASTADLGAERPSGSSASMTFHFPKGYGRSLKGCEVEWLGRAWRVVGDPQPLMEANTPGPFNLTVECEAVDG